MEWASSLNIVTSQVRGRVPITILHLDGRINLSNTDALEKAAEAAREAGARYLLLDLNNVPSLTSAGLRSIHWIYKMANEGESQPMDEDAPVTGSTSKSPYMKLFTTSPHVLKVLHVAGFDLYIDTYEDLQQAISAF